MSTLRSGLDELRAVDLRHLSDTELEDRLSELRRASGVIDAESARTLAEVERRGSYADSGHLSITSWVEHRFQASWSEAANKVRAARALEAMPEVREALYDGEVSPSVVGQLVAAHEASPEEFSKVEATLVDAEAAARADSERYDRRGLHVSPTLEGMVRVDGNLDPETGQTLITALRSVTDASARDGSEDPRTPAQRRCDALGEIARQHLARSEPLDVGRKTPVVPAPLRRAVVVRDRHCRFPGCDRPAPWCDAHHAVHWTDGGHTKLSNLLLLWRRHRRMVHGGFRLQMTDAGPRFSRPDGTPLEDRAPLE